METVQLTIEDIGKLRDFVRIASTRGAFRAEEFTEIGRVIDRANQFLHSVDEAMKLQNLEGESSDDESTEETKGSGE